MLIAFHALGVPLLRATMVPVMGGVAEQGEVVGQIIGVSVDHGRAVEGPTPLAHQGVVQPDGGHLSEGVDWVIRYVRYGVG